MDVSLLPQEFQDIISQEEGDLEGMDITVIPQDDLMWNGQIAIPGNDYDLNEANMAVQATHNLRKLGRVSLLGAAFCDFYEKIDANVPAYALIESDELGDDDFEFYRVARF